MVRYWKRAAVGICLLGLGISIGSLGRSDFENKAKAEVRRVGAGSTGAPAGVQAKEGGAAPEVAVMEPAFPMIVYKGPNRTVKYFSAGRECTALNVAEVLLYPGVMVFKDNRDVIGGTGVGALGEFQIVVGQ
jgi:hypothetical protein